METRVMRTDRQGAPRVAYIMSRFPKITETFILYEILELERGGIAVEICPLLREKAAVVHPEAARMMPRIRFRPFLNAAIAASMARWAVRAPVRTVRAVAEALWHTRRSPNFFVGALGVLPKTLHMAETLQRQGIDHVHAHFATHPALAALVIHRLTGIPFSFTAHGSDIHIDQTMFDRKLRASAFAVTVCDYNVGFLAERFGPWVRERLEVMHCGTDTEVFRPQEGDAAARPEGAPFRILCVAALREVKGHRFLIEACRRLRDAGVDLRCDLVGEGELKDDLARRVADAGLSDVVRLRGALPREAVRDAMHAADTVVLPSILGRRGDREGIPVCLMEAMACGRPVVSSRQSGIVELIADGTEGLLCPPGDAAALADALGRLAADPDLRRTLGAAARDKVLREFDLRRNAQALGARLVRQIAGSGAAAALSPVPAIRPPVPLGARRPAEETGA
jgi:glycosyltransferase involved in cell wall biosynthesis